MTVEVDCKREFAEGIYFAGVVDGDGMEFVKVMVEKD
jgi:hypothetical protein